MRTRKHIIYDSLIQNFISHHNITPSPTVALDRLDLFRFCAGPFVVSLGGAFRAALVEGAFKFVCDPDVAN